MYKNQNISTRPAQGPATIDKCDKSVGSKLGRRTFMKRVGLAGVAAVPASTLLIRGTSARANSGNSRLQRGDVSILRFLAAAEILETDLWQQYTELALGNEAFQLALEVLDGDMPTYVNQNTRDEFTHQNFINQYLSSKGHKPVSLEEFRNLPSSQATGSNKGAKRLTNLTDLTVDTSWFLRYRLPGNPDFGDTFPQIVNLQNVPAIPSADLPLPTDPTFGFQIQLIANTAGFHFATIEQGGASLYQSFLPKVSSLEVLEIVGAIGGTEIMHFQTWQDKAGNAPELVDNHGNEVFPQLPLAPDATPDGIDHSQPQDTNQIMPAPCKFIDTSLPLCSVIRPISTDRAGAQAAVTALTASGLFNGQSDGFFKLLAGLAEEADEASRND
jgi:hypothetical protein